MKMTRMALVVLFLSVAIPSSAGIVYKQLPDPTSGGGAAIKTCTASAGFKENCNKCESAYDRSGNYLGILCVPVKQSAQCTCTSEGTSCSTQGTCTYDSSVW